MTASTDGRDAGMERLAAALRQEPPVPLPARFAAEVTQRLMPRRPPPPRWAATVPGWLRWLFTPRALVLRPAMQLGWAAVLCVLAVGGARWSMTSTEPAVAPPVLVRFAVRAPAAREVSVAGDFNAWNVQATQLEDADGDGIWHGLVRVQPGVYQYMFVIDGQSWMVDPLSGETVDDGFGQRNSVIRVHHRAAYDATDPRT